MTTKNLTNRIAVGPLLEEDLSAADKIMRLAFGTFLGMPQPETFMGDADIIKTRWTADPSAAFCARVNGTLAGSIIAVNWGSVGFFGPLAVHPDYWNFGIGKKLVEPVMATFDRWGVRHAGLFTFSHSAKHINLYQKFGFTPRFLTAVLLKKVVGKPEDEYLSLYSGLSESQKQSALAECRQLTESLYEGLDVTREILSIDAQNLGDTILIQNSSALAAFAVCHWGAGSEAGSNVLYVKFAVSRAGKESERHFQELLIACEALAAGRKLSQMLAGANMARSRAYHAILSFGFRLTPIIGVAMQKPNEPGYNREDVFLIDDWR